MDLIKSMRENYLLVCAILFILLLIAYALFYKRTSKNTETKPKKNEGEESKDTFIQYTFMMIFALLGMYALYLIFIQYVKPSMAMVGGGSGSNSMDVDISKIRMSGEDVMIGFLDE